MTLRLLDQHGQPVELPAKMADGWRGWIEWDREDAVSVSRIESAAARLTGVSERRTAVGPLPACTIDTLHAL